MGKRFFDRVERRRGGGSGGMILVIADPTQMGDQEQVQWKEVAAVNYRPAILCQKQVQKWNQRTEEDMKLLTKIILKGIKWNMVKVDNITRYGRAPSL